MEEATLLEGFDRAHDRFNEARRGKDPEAAFFALFETLNWAASLDERLGRLDSPTLRAIRFTRNRVHHHWPDALYLDESGVADPLADPAVPFEWRFRAELPPRPATRRNDAGIDEYVAVCADQPVRNVLGAAWLDFTQAVPNPRPAELAPPNRTRTMYLPAPTPRASCAPVDP